MEYPLDEPIRDGINTAYRVTTQTQAIAGTAVTAAMLVIMWFIKNVDLEAADADRTLQLQGDINEKQLAESITVPAEVK